MYDSTSLIMKIANSYKLDVKIFCIIQFLKNRMSCISSNLYEGNKPITFQDSQCWIIFKKNLVEWNELKSGKEGFVESKKIREVIREKTMEKAKGWKEVYAKLFIVD